MNFPLPPGYALGPSELSQEPLYYKLDPNLLIGAKIHILCFKIGVNAVFTRGINFIMQCYRLIVIKFIHNTLTFLEISLVYTELYKYIRLLYKRQAPNLKYENNFGFLHI